MFKNIIFFRYRLLSEHLKNGAVDDSLAVKYMILCTVLAGGAISIPFEITPAFFKYARLDYILSISEFIIVAIINIIGIWYLFHANNQGDGKDFFKRLICLAFPTSLFVVVIFGVPAFFLFALITGSFPVIDRLSELVLIILLEIVYYRINYNCLSFISGSKIMNQKD